MENLALKMEMITNYHKISFTDRYILGFRYKHNIYACTCDAAMVNQVICLDKASRGQGYAIRFKPTVAQCLYMLPFSELLCSEKFFDEQVAESKYNNGEIFEKMITEMNGQIWEKDDVPFTEAGDIKINGLAYQIKFTKATFTNEKSLASLMAKVGK